MRRILIAIALLVVVDGTARAESDKPLLLQRPTLSKTHVAFGYAGDLWIVGREGGEARRLTSGAGLEFGPIFSPDGSQIAFTGEYDGNMDVYVLPATGGEPRRLTFHPGVDVAVGWTPDGKGILFSSGRNSYSRYNKLFTIPVTGAGLPAELPLPMGEQARSLRTAPTLRMCPSGTAGPCPTPTSPGSATVAASPHPSGSPTWPIRASPRSRVKIRTRAARCGSKASSTSFRIAPVR